MTHIEHSRSGVLRLGRRGNESGSQVVELAVVLPFLIVLAVGIFDFGGALNLKQKLNNAAREAARFATSQPTIDLTLGNPPSVQAVGDVVVNYLKAAKVVSTCGG